jgi:beta-carotene 3-hydroxylase
MADWQKRRGKSSADLVAVATRTICPLQSRQESAYSDAMQALINLGIVIATTAFMEFVAWWSHKYVMHGWGWGWHRDHHEPHDNVLEKNDLYAIVGSVISISLFIIGAWVWQPATWMGIGVMIYGIIYTLIHDGLVHQRYFRWVPKSGYAKRIVQAHKLHHATIGKEGGVSFGFVIAEDPVKLKQELKRQREAGIAVVRESAGAL